MSTSYPVQKKIKDHRNMPIQKLLMSWHRLDKTSRLLGMKSGVGWYSGATMILGYILHLGEIIMLDKCYISGSEKRRKRQSDEQRLSGSKSSVNSGNLGFRL